MAEGEGSVTGHGFKVYPVTRIDGRADIEVLLDPHQKVSEARFRALEFRGFEELLRGIPAATATRVVSRICGSCGPFHLLASCMALEKAAGVEVPVGAAEFRRLLAWLLIAQDHLTTMMYRFLPDYALPMSDVAVKNVVGLYKVEQESVGRLGSALSAFSDAVSRLAGLPIHPAVVVPGGTSCLPAREQADRALESLKGCEDDLREVLRLVEMLVKRDARLIGEGGAIDGTCAAVTTDELPEPDGDTVTVRPFGPGETLFLEPEAFLASLVRAQVEWSFLVPVTRGGDRTVLVGPLARVDIGFGQDTPWAALELKRVMEQWGHPLDKEYFCFPAVALEVVRAWEKACALLGSEGLFEGSSMTAPGVVGGTGTAVVDSPRGIIVHRVRLDDDGVVESYEVTSPLQFNIEVINRRLTQAAKDVVTGLDISEQIAQRLQLVARSFGPCVPCGTH